MRIPGNTPTDNTIILQAHMDMVCLKEPATLREFIDRFLITAEAYHIKSIILLNKTDLLESYDSDRLAEFIQTYKLAGYECIEMSVKENRNVSQVYERLKHKINLIAGNSGVGKSSLINLINPALKLKTDEISGYHKSGKHTTTFCEMFSLDKDTYVIDSPGIRGFGLIDMEKSEIGLYFPEIFSISKDCRFYNCTHLHEPDCAVVQAVKEGRIGLSRFESYVSIMTGDESKYR